MRSVTACESRYSSISIGMRRREVEAAAGRHARQSSHPPQIWQLFSSWMIRYVASAHQECQLQSNADISSVLHDALPSTYKSVVVVLVLSGVVYVYNSLLISAITRKVGGFHTSQAAAPRSAYTLLKPQLFARLYIGKDEEIW